MFEIEVFTENCFNYTCSMRADMAVLGWTIEMQKVIW